MADAQVAEDPPPPAADEAKSRLSPKHTVEGEAFPKQAEGITGMIGSGAASGEALAAAGGVDAGENASAAAELPPPADRFVGAATSGSHKKNAAASKVDAAVKRPSSGKKRPPPEGGSVRSTLPGAKKARTAYFIFADDVRPEVQAANPGAVIAVLSKSIGQKWGALGEEEKSKYHARAAEEKGRLKEAGLLLLPGRSSEEANQAGSAVADLQFPVGRIKKICRLDPDVKGISREASLLIAKCAEQFTNGLGQEVFKVAHLLNRCKLLSQDVADVCSTRENFLFLREDMADLLREQKKAAKEAKAARTSAGTGTGNLDNFFSSSTSTTATATTS